MLKRVIIDTTPFGAVTDALILSSLVDGVLLILNVGQTPLQVASDTRDRLLKANA